MFEKIKNIFGGGVSTAVDSIGNAIDKIDNSEDKLKMQLDFKSLISGLESKAMEIDGKLKEAAANNVLAEIKGDSWLQKNWRPIMVLMFVYIIFNNYVLVPYFSLPMCTLDDNVWIIIKISITGYGAERGLNKLGLDLSQILKKK